MTRRKRGLLACLLGFALLGTASPVGALDVEGTWFVLVHYTDDHAANPEQERWEDKVWIFERKGRRLEWTEYPIVVFEDDSGRFERRGTGQYARILHYWEPDSGQRANIKGGLQVNTRGSKKKKLRGNDAEGWSSGRSKSAASASVVTYQEVWEIQGLPDRPVFSRSDFMGGGRTDTMEGRIEYAASEVVRAGSEIRGTFERDGSRHGTFKMWRSGDTQSLKGKKDQRELQQQAFMRDLQSNPQLQEQVARTVEEQLREQGLPLSDEELRTLAVDSVTWTAQGVPQNEVNRRLNERLKELSYGFAKLAAKHDDTARYAWPFDSEVPRQLLQGVRGDDSSSPTGQLLRGFRRRDEFKYAFSFDLPEGTPVVAARVGKVVRVVDGYTQGGPQQGMGLKSNVVIVRHDDGTFAIYSHLQKGIAVKNGQPVDVGDRLGSSGATGQVFQPELFFAVQRLDADGKPHSVDIRFADGTAVGLVPVSGSYYGGP